MKLRYSKALAEDVISSLLMSIMAILLILGGYTTFVAVSSASKVQAYIPVDTSSTFSLLVSKCFGSEIEKEKLKSCIHNIKEKLTVKVTDLFTGESFEVSNTALWEVHVDYWNEFVYPLKKGEETHPAKVRIEFKSFKVPFAPTYKSGES